MNFKLKKTTDAVLKPVDISEWTDDVKAYVKALTTREQMVFVDCVGKYTSKELGETERAESMLSACVMVLVGADAKPLFTLDDVSALMECSFTPIQRIIAAVSDQTSGVSFIKN